MKKKTVIPVLIYALPVLVVAATTTGAAPEPKPATIEKRIEVHSAAAPAPGVPMPPPTPVTFLGLEVAPVDEALAAQLKLPPEHGLVVRFIVPDSPAAAAGLQRHDVLTRLDDQLLIAPRQLSALVRSHKEGDTIKLTYIRAGAETRATATLAKRMPPPPHVGDTMHWIGEGGGVHAVPSHRSFTFRSGDGRPGAMFGEERAEFGARTGGPHVMIYHPKARIVYREGDVTLEVTSTEQGRLLEARGADGAVIYSGPINTPEQRAAVPADLQKHLEKLDALEPGQFDIPVPAPMPAPAPTASWESTVPGGADDVLIHSTVEIDTDAPTSGLAPATI